MVMSARRTALCLIGGGLLALTGFGLAANPYPLLETTARNLWGFLGGALRLFPKGMQAIASRVVGVIVMCVGLFIMSLPWTIDDVLWSAYSASNANYWEQFDQFGNQAADLLNSGENEIAYGFDYDSEIIAAYRSSDRSVAFFGVWESFDEKTTVEQLVAEIESEVEASLRETTKALRKQEALAEVIASLPQQFGIDVEQAQPAASPEPEPVPDLTRADEALASASQAWRAGNREQALQHAKEALRIRRHHLGDDHPDTIEVMQMLQTAGGD